MPRFCGLSCINTLVHGGARGVALKLKFPKRNHIWILMDGVLKIVGGLV